LHFHYIQYSSDLGKAPEILISVTIASDLKVNSWIYKAPVPQRMCKDLIPSGFISKMSQLLNWLAFCKSTLLDSASQGASLSQKSMQVINLSIQLLQGFVNEQGVDGADTSQIDLVNFIIEQLQLLSVNKNGRRYSTNMIKTAFLWQLTSTTLYKKLRMFFVLPSIRRLQGLSAGASVSSGCIDLDYLKLRTKDLTEREKIVTLMVDEVYIAERVEYSNGSFIGLTENGTPAKTVLGFMVQSVCSNYKDIVCLVPVSTLNSAMLHTWFKKVLHALHDIFYVIAVSTDNHICNRYV